MFYNVMPHQLTLSMTRVNRIRSSKIKISKEQSGFTLIELVAVIVILGVFAMASVKFIAFGTQIYVEANDRQLTLSKSRFAIERMTREIRGAIPNSVRVSANNRCIEFSPIKASGAYRDDIESAPTPISPTISNNIDVIGWLGGYDAGDRMFIYPTSSDDIYNVSSNKVGFLDGTVIGTSPELNITFNAVISFVEHSPKRRYYTADQSINYCFIDNGIDYDLYRFIATDFAETQDVPVSAKGVLMAEGLTNDLSIASSHPFDISGSTLNRNSVINLYLEFNANLNESMFFNHEVHIPNVP